MTERRGHRSSAPLRRSPPSVERGTHPRRRARRRRRRRQSRRARPSARRSSCPTQRPMTAETWFDLASLTKVIFTTPRILALAEAGRHRSRCAADHACCPISASTMPTTGSGRSPSASASGTRRRSRRCFRSTPMAATPNCCAPSCCSANGRPGPPVYSDINFILLGLALERLERRSIRDMDPAPGFAWSADPDDAAATEDCTWRDRVLSGEVHDDNCSALQGAGHAGLFGTAASVLDFAQGLLDGSGASAAVDRADAHAACRRAARMAGSAPMRAGRAASIARPAPSAIPALPAPGSGSISTAAVPGPCSPTASIRPVISTAASSRCAVRSAISSIGLRSFHGTDLGRRPDDRHRARRQYRRRAAQDRWRDASTISAPTRSRPTRNRSARCSKRRWRRRGNGISRGRSRRSSPRPKSS